MTSPDIKTWAEKRAKGIDFDFWGSTHGSQAADEIQKALLEAFDKGRESGLEEAAEIVKSEEELVGDMPEKVWEFVTSSRLNCANVQRMVVKRTKENILEGIRCADIGRM